MRGRTRRSVAWLTFAGFALAGGAVDAAESWCDQRLRPAYEKLQRVDIEEPWFHVYELEAGVFALYEPYNFQEVISYLVLGSERALLFDTGMGMGRIRPVVERLTKLPVSVLNSHTHFDHIGGNAEFDRILGMDTAFTRESAKGVPHEAVAGEAQPESFCATHLAGFDPATYRIRPFRVTELVKDGSVIELGGRRLEVLAIPGHTPDSVALLDRKAGLLFTGDTFYEGPIWLFFPGTDLEAYARSIARLAALAPVLSGLHPAHNTPVASPDRLPQVRDAFAEVRANRRKAEPRDAGRVEYLFDGFSFLMAQPSRR